MSIRRVSSNLKTMRGDLMKRSTIAAFNFFSMTSIIFFVCIFSIATGFCKPQNTGIVAWKIYGNANCGKARPSYLVGTVHSMTYPEYSFNSRFDEYMDSCEVFVMESGKEISLSYGRNETCLPGKVTLKDLMPPDEWKKLSDLCFSNGLDRETERFAPWYLEALIMRPELRKKSGTTMDEHLMNMALKKGIKVVHLETMATGSLNKIPLEAQIRELKALAAGSKEIELVNAAVIGAYNLADHEKLYDTEHAEGGRNDLRAKITGSRISSILVDERNAFWLPEIEKRINSGGAFIAVGAAHLCGAGGIVETLRKKGYAASDVSASAAR